MLSKSEQQQFVIGSAVKIIKKHRPKPPDRKATDDQLAALQDLFSGLPPDKPLVTREQQEKEHQQALDGLFAGLERKPMGIARAEEARSRAKVIQKRQREIDPLEIEAAEQEKAFLVRQQQRAEKKAAIAREIDSAIGKARLAQRLQAELECYSQCLAAGVLGAFRASGIM